jgi:hypothetical protein
MFTRHIEIPGQKQRPGPHFSQVFDTPVAKKHPSVLNLLPYRLEILNHGFRGGFDQNCEHVTKISCCSGALISKNGESENE